jgi:hypothetical protein
MVRNGLRRLIWDDCSETVVFLATYPSDKGTRIARWSTRTYTCANTFSSGCDMSFVLKPWQLLLVSLAGWVNLYQQQLIDFQDDEIQILLQRQGKKRLLLTDDERRRLAAKGKVLGRKALGQITTIVTPDTILRWHRQLIAQKWDYSDRQTKKPGRPATPEEITQLNY